MNSEEKVGIEQIAQGIQKIERLLKMMLVLIGVGAVFGIVWFLYWLSNRL